MKETTFIEQNKRKWAKFEKLSNHKNNDPDEVSKLFNELTEDLSYARTYYPRRSVRVYLNQLAQGVFTKLYKQKKQPLGSFKLFWVEKVPLEMYRIRYNMLSALIFFGLAVFIGAISQHFDNDFVNLILGENYVEQTEERILNGDPMGVYGTSPQVEMFFGITLNNIRVSFLVFALGFFGSILSYFLLLSNGIMLGAFQWWFKAKGLLLTSFLAVWIHGAFEISAIVIAGAAGITVGNGLLFPKSYTRLQSLVFSAKRGLTIMLSLMPVFIIAGFLESFITRYYNVLPSIVKLIIICTSFFVIIFYYGIYPFIVARRYPDKVKLKEEPRYIPQRKITFTKIRTVGELFSDAFYIFMTKISGFTNIFFRLIFPLALVLSAGIFAMEIDVFDVKRDWHHIFGRLFGTFEYISFLSFFGWSAILALLIGAAYFVANPNHKTFRVVEYFKYTGKSLIWLFIYGMLIMCMFLFLHWFFQILLFILLGPILMQIPSIILIEKTNFFTAFGRAFTFEKSSYGEGIGNISVFVLITIIFFFVLHNPFETSLLTLLDEIIEMTTNINVDKYKVVINAFNSIIYLLFIGFMLTLIFISYALFYHSNLEKSKAKGLYERLEKFGTRSRTFETNTDFD